MKEDFPHAVGFKTKSTVENEKVNTTMSKLSVVQENIAERENDYNT